MDTREKKRGGCSIENSVSYSIPFTVTFTFREYLPYKPTHLKEIGRFRSGIRETSVFDRIWKKKRKTPLKRLSKEPMPGILHRSFEFSTGKSGWTTSYTVPIILKSIARK